MFVVPWAGGGVRVEGRTVCDVADVMVVDASLTRSSRRPASTSSSTVLAGALLATGEVWAATGAT